MNPGLMEAEVWLNAVQYQKVVVSRGSNTSTAGQSCEDEHAFASEALSANALLIAAAQVWDSSPTCPTPAGYYVDSTSQSSHNHLQCRHL